MPLCCREENGYTSDPAHAAQKWGNYNCDTSLPAITSMFQFINETINPDVIFWTGDMSAHSVWENSNEEVAEVNQVVAKLVQSIFEDRVMVYPL
jgi:sphingomyelin phosphodiesterase